MLGRCRILFALILLGMILGLSQAQTAAPISPSVFLRGLELANGVRYTATFIKPTDDTVLRNLSVEISLPADAQFTEMLVSRQVQFDVIRRNRQGQLTLIWQISRIDDTTPLDAFSFTLAEPLTNEIEFYLFWQDEQGQSFLENFFELPSTIRANETEASISPINQEFAFVGNTGIQVSANSPSPLNFRVLANDFNPPAEYGAVWWCSLVELSGLAEGDSVIVLVPLRRPVAPFTELFLFQQEANDSWLALEEKGVVSADGQFVMYRHTGGLIATGGEEEIRQEVVPVEQAVIEEAQPPQENPQPQNNEQPQSAPVDNIVVEVQASPIPQQNPVDTGNNNQQNPPQPSPIPPSPIPPTFAPAATQNNTVQDGSSNTIFLAEVTATSAPVLATSSVSVQPIGEASPTRPLLVTRASSIQPQVTATASPSNIVGGITNGTRSPNSPSILPTLGDGSVRFISSPTPTGTVADGSSNTILFGETRTPNSPNILPTLGDGSVRFISSPTPTGTVADGSGNTILFGETRTPNSPNILPTLSDGSVRVVSTATLLPFIETGTPPAISTVADGSSNTILFGETRTPNSPNILPTLSDGSVRVVSSPTPTGTVADGSSNTILFGETRTPNSPNILPTLSDGSVRVVSTATLLPFIETGTPPAISTVADGSSNTIIFGEATFTPTVPALVTRAGSVQPIDNASITPSPENTLSGATNGIVVTATATVSQPMAATFTPTTQNVAATPVPSPVSVPTQIVIVSPPPFGSGGTRVLIVQTGNGSLNQCQVGGILCVSLNRRAGNGLR